MRKLSAGTIVRLPDGREGTVVYYGLDGYGIKWGRHLVTLDDIEKAAQGHNVLFGNPPENYPWKADALLREPHPVHGIMECVGEEFEIASAST